MSRSITTLEKALSLAAVTISAFESCLRASTSLHSSILRQARSTRNCCSMVRGISEDDTATTPFAEANLASATPQLWKLRPKKNQKLEGPLKCAQKITISGKGYCHQNGWFCSTQQHVAGIRRLRNIGPCHKRFRDGHKRKEAITERSSSIHSWEQL